MTNRILLSNGNYVRNRSKPISGSLFNHPSIAFFKFDDFPIKSIKPSSKTIHDQGSLSCFDFEDFLNSTDKKINIISNFFPTYCQFNYQMQEFLKKNFGSFPIYFISNYLIR
jgi:hypothetical protein